MPPRERIHTEIIGTKVPLPVLRDLDLLARSRLTTRGGLMRQLIEQEIARSPAEIEAQREHEADKGHE
jgi:hypothetical protein